MSSVQTIIAPSRVGPFHFRGTVGEGAFSVVKLSYHEELQQFFACKIVPRNRMNNKELMDRFEIEIRINQQIHHPGIVQIVDLLKDDLNFYIFMEFCPNGELFKYIVERQRLPEPEAQVFLLQLLEALNYVHGMGVTHRDLKPENVLFDQVGHIKISDFGLARFVGKNNLVSTPCGSPCYASPECLSGRPYDGKTTDVWSLGVILFAMVTGQLPWTKRNQAQLFSQIKRGDYIIPDYLSDECKDLISQMLTVDPSKRITIKEALDHPWVKSTVDEIVIQQQNFSIVSLKKVDGFFNDESIFADLNKEEKENIEKQLSTLNLNIGKIVKEISSKKAILSPVKRRRLNTFTAQSQPIKAIAIPIISPQVITSKTFMNPNAPNSHTPELIQTALLKRKNSFGREILPKTPVRTKSPWVHQ